MIAEAAIVAVACLGTPLVNVPEAHRFRIRTDGAFEWENEAGTQSFVTDRLCVAAERFYTDPTPGGRYTVRCYDYDGDRVLSAYTDDFERELGVWIFVNGQNGAKVFTNARCEFLENTIGGAP